MPVNQTKNNEKVVLVTGSAQRVGASIIKELHARGWQVIIHYRHSEQAALSLASTLNAQRANSAFIIKADLQQHAQIQQLAEQVLQVAGRLDALVNNASTFYPTSIGEATLADWDDLMISNARAPFFLSQALTPALTASRGCIVNIVDIHATRPFKQHTIYCMAKAALGMMTASLAKELAPYVRVNGVAPGAILWPEDNTPSAIASNTQQQILASVPLARSGSPEDIARTVAFLIEDAPYITGQIIAVDGGRTHTLGME
jgi:pteridine reductase